MHHIMREKNTYFFKLKKKKKSYYPNLHQCFHRHQWNNPDLPFYLGGKLGLLTASAVILKYRRTHSFCWMYLFSRNPIFFLSFCFLLKIISNYLIPGDANYSSCRDTVPWS